MSEAKYEGPKTLEELAAWPEMWVGSDTAACSRKKRGKRMKLRDIDEKGGGLSELESNGWCSFPKNALLCLWGLCGAIDKHFDIDKKSRIVVEYDPEAANCRVMFFTDKAESGFQEDELPPRLAPN